MPEDHGFAVRQRGRQSLDAAFLGGHRRLDHEQPRAFGHRARRGAEFGETAIRIAPALRHRPTRAPSSTRAIAAKQPIDARRAPSNRRLATTTKANATGKRRSAAQLPLSQSGISTAATIMAAIGQRMGGANLEAPLRLA